MTNEPVPVSDDPYVVTEAPWVSVSGRGENAENWLSLVVGDKVFFFTLTDEQCDELRWQLTPVVL